MPERPTDDHLNPAGERTPVVLYRGRLVDIDSEDVEHPGITIESPWGPPASAELIGDSRCWLPAPDPRFNGPLAIGDEVRVAVQRREGIDQVVAIEVAEPLDHVTADELGWTLSTIADRGRSETSGQLGVTTTEEITATIAGWSDPDGVSQIEARVRAAIDIAREVGYAVTAYSHELDPTIAEADTQRLIVLTDSGRQACVGWEGARTTRNVGLLGERPEQASKARAWDIAAGQFDRFRLRHSIEDPRGLGEPSSDHWQDRDRAHIERTVAAAGRFIDPPALSPDLGFGR